jgi:ADP-ribose pyrophosphatase YjhB (NUDIX family)
VIVSTAGLTRIAAYCVVSDTDGRILLCRLSLSELDVGKWTLPGGGLDFGEEPAAAAVRELEEETGLVGRITGLLGIDSQLYPPRPGRDIPFHAIRVVYRAQPVMAELRNELDGSTDRAEWFTRDQLASLPTVDLVDWAMELLDTAAH